MKCLISSILIFVSLPIFADKLAKEHFYSGTNTDTAISRQYHYGKNGNLESITQISDESEIRVHYIYKKKQLTKAEEYNDDIFISRSIFLYREKEKIPYRREVYDSFDKLKSYSLFTFESDGKNPVSIETYNNKNELSERMVFIYSEENSSESEKNSSESERFLSEIRIFDNSEKLILRRRQTVDKNKNAVMEEVIFQDKIIRIVKRDFIASRRKNSKVFSLPENFFDFR